MAEDDDDDEYHESLDRILSSSSPSTSASDDDAANPRRLPRRRSAATTGAHLFRGVSSRLHTMYDIWSSPPVSVDERRRGLLKMLGLLGDPFLARPGSLAEESPVPDRVENLAVVPDSGDPEDERYCRIRNLDNGEEFVVKEVAEDGMWEKLREVGTGRQLTMEEFQVSVTGRSPIVLELMRRQSGERGSGAGEDAGGARPRRRGNWLRSIRNMAGGVAKRMDRRSSDERDTSSEKGGRRSSSATDDSQEVCERVKVRLYSKSWKELSGLYMNQEIQGHCGSIWSVRFSGDGRYLATAGEDCVVHVWQVVESERKRDPMAEKGVGVEENLTGSNASPEPTASPANLERENSEKGKGIKASTSRKSFSLDHVVFTDCVFALAERPSCTFRGHQRDVLDLSWSKSEQLLSSSMDKTVRLWDMSNNSCLKVFSHSDYVTCIQFNPVDDNYFISGSLDSKLRLWNVEDRQVVDWIDLHEMVTAVCYTPDGQGALVGSHKGTCNLYKLSGNCFDQRTEINLQNKKKRSHLKKITGFQFVPGSLSEVLITSADSRIRVVDKIDLVHKLKGFRNTSSQISACLTADGNHVVCASEDSRVYIWRYDADLRTGRVKGVVSVSQSYEHFHCRNVSVAAAWPGASLNRLPHGGGNNWKEDAAFSSINVPPVPALQCSMSPLSAPNCNGNHFLSASSSNTCTHNDPTTCSEDRMLPSPNAQKQSPRSSSELNIRELHDRSAWGIVIVTAGRGGEIKVFQNFGCPIRV